MLEYNSAYVCLCFCLLFFIVFAFWYIIIKTLKGIVKNGNEKHKKEMELMQAQLDYYKNKSSENDT